MQTFMPLPDYRLTAACLDQRRLGKQRVEGFQILELLLGERESRWASHPAVEQWRGWEYQLGRYIMAICLEWRLRGCLDNVESRTCELLSRYNVDSSNGVPPFMGNNEYHRSHRSRLMFKGRKDALETGIKEMLRAEGIRLANRRRACVEGWLLERGNSAMRDMELDEVEEMEHTVRTLGYCIPRNHYASYDWDVTDRNEIPYVWPSRQLTTA